MPRCRPGRRPPGEHLLIMKNPLHRRDKIDHAALARALAALDKAGCPARVGAAARSRVRENCPSWSVRALDSSGADRIPAPWRAELEAGTRAFVARYGESWYRTEGERVAQRAIIPRRGSRRGVGRRVLPRGRVAVTSCVRGETTLMGYRPDDQPALAPLSVPGGAASAATCLSAWGFLDQFSRTSNSDRQDEAAPLAGPRQP